MRYTGLRHDHFNCRLCVRSWFEQEFACCLVSAETCRVWCCPRGFACRIDICGRAGRASRRFSLCCGQEEVSCSRDTCHEAKTRMIPAWGTIHQTTTLRLFLGCDVRCDVVSFADSRSVRCDERSDADPFRVRNCASRSATSYRCSVASVNANGSSSSMSASVVAEACLLQSADRVCGPCRHASGALSN
ncbi:uncharacterized protein B0I36DRAFT_33810 [Microdochium trichocladiopsis]|uniref:Uncharacterized protein n=1 Tax=Microdochium trichocladiopsis TaxID=1682393 RepID=A0A9P9BKW3_9PEZI|nr:uncharacterized protein B0I36DRAFT_33810 [Microdochium trichocladiopsis]KAH7021626.1 hypothetical protein B0I36DRAFT_33810 [Microdochium trichocladiopsis]